jgi:hypothetical protein
MMLFTRSMVTTVSGFAGSSSASAWNQPSSACSRAHFSKRPSMLIVAPRPFTRFAVISRSGFQGHDESLPFEMRPANAEFTVRRECG